MPSQETASASFEALGHRPEEALRALALLKSLHPGHNADSAMTATAVALRPLIAERELARLAGMGALHQAVFERLARGLLAPFSKAAKEAYAGEVGHVPNTSEVQTALNSLVGAGYAVRAASGQYECADPLVQQLWLDRLQLRAQAPDSGRPRPGAIVKSVAWRALWPGCSKMPARKTRRAQHLPRATEPRVAATLASNDANLVSSCCAEQAPSVLRRGDPGRC